MKPVILAFVRCYLPGFKSGGPIRSVANLVGQLNQDFEFRIVTSDRDSLDRVPYRSVKVGEWNDVGVAKVLYLSPEQRSLGRIRTILRETSHDLLYLNSFFNPTFTLRPLLTRYAGRAPRRPIVVAPRGEFSESALGLKSLKKRPYVWFARFAGLYEDVIWHASTEHEAADIRRTLGQMAKTVILAPNLSGTLEDSGGGRLHRGRGQTLRVLFLSRISPMKNLDFALRVLSRVGARIEFNIYGPVDDETYWQKCQRLLTDIGDNVRVSVMGPVQHSDVSSIMEEHDLLFLPTLGENYGHVIAESVSVGTPVLIANTTPWRNLARAGVGWDLPLDSEADFAARIEQCASMNNDEYTRWRSTVRKYASERFYDPMLAEASRQLFFTALVNHVREPRAWL